MGQLRSNYLVTWFAMLAIACQIFFGIAHVTAMLVAVSAGPHFLDRNSDSLSFSLLQICSANGLIAIEDDPHSSDDKDQIAKDRCPVCVSAAVGPALHMVVDATPFAIMDSDIVEHTSLISLVARAPPHLEPIRGPPYFSSFV